VENNALNESEEANVGKKRGFVPLPPGKFSASAHALIRLPTKLHSVVQFIQRIYAGGQCRC